MNATEHRRTSSESLRDPRWFAKQTEILKRDNYSCAACGKNQNEIPVNVYHIVFRKIDPWAYQPNEYRSYCINCWRVRSAMISGMIDQIRMAIADVATKDLSLICERITAKIGGVL